MRMENNSEDEDERPMHARNDGFESELAGESKQLLTDPMEHQKFYKNNLSDGSYNNYPF